MSAWWRRGWIPFAPRDVALAKAWAALWRKPKGSHFGRPSLLEEILSARPPVPTTGSGVKSRPLPMGCICPAGANLSCENPECPRKARQFAPVLSRAVPPPPPPSPILKSGLPRAGHD